MTQIRDLDVAIYLRKSRSDEHAEKEAEMRGETYDTLARHRSELLAICRRDGHNVIDIFEEVVSGAYIAERPQMQKLLENVKTMKYDAVLVVDLDRLGRGDKIDQGRIERVFKDSNTLIITPAEVHDLNEESGEFTVEVKSFLARMEYKQIRKRLLAGRNRSAREGKDVGRKPPYGYDKTQDKRLTINEEEAQWVRLMYQWCIEGQGRMQIAENLTALGTPSPSGKDQWSHVTVRKILSNPKYKGDQVYGRVKWMKQEDGTYKTRIVIDPDLLTVSPNAHEAIVEPEIWERAQQAIKNRIKAPVKKSLNIVNPLAGIIKCKKCGKAILANNPANRPNKYLFCGNPKCNTKMISLSKVEEILLHQLEVILHNLKASKKYREQKAQTDLHLNLGLRRIDKIKTEIEKLHTQRDNLHDLLEQGIYNSQMFLDRNRKIQERLKELESDLEEVEKRVAVESVREHHQRNTIPNIQRALNAYRQSESVADKNNILRSFIKEIRYLREPGWDKPYQFEIEIELID